MCPAFIYLFISLIIEKFFQILKNNACFSESVVLLYSSRLSGKIRVWRSLVSRLNGVQEASSSNLDTRTKKAETVFHCFCFFLCGEIRKIKCNYPVDSCLPPAGRRQHLNVPNLDTQTKKQKEHLLFLLFSFVK